MNTKIYCEVCKANRSAKVLGDKKFECNHCDEVYRADDNGKLVSTGEVLRMSVTKNGLVPTEDNKATLI